MRKACFLAASLFLSNAANTDPVVLIHGLGGSSSNWDYIAEIEDAGLPVIALDINKFSSTWDRACEIYAQLKGTVVDFGVCHSRDHGHERFGRDFTGQALFPEWDEDNQIHIWGHSLGGPTITAVERILRQGSNCPEDTSPFFTGGNDWLKSLTAFSGVLSGTSAVELMDVVGLTNLISTFVVALAGVIDNTFIDDDTIDFSYWGLTKEPGESFASYWEKVIASGILLPTNQDISTYDLSLEGARANNAEAPYEYADTYYFSFATERTFAVYPCFAICPRQQDPEPEMTESLKITADWIGRIGPDIIRENDGLVNWINQICPFVSVEESDRCNEFDDEWPIGEWVHQDVDYLDHVQIVFRDNVNDATNYERSAKKIFVDHAIRTAALP